MLRFLFSRLLQGVVVIFAVLVITFVLMNAAPGGQVSEGTLLVRVEAG